MENGDWVTEFFIEKAGLFKKLLDSIFWKVWDLKDVFRELLERHGISRGSLILDLGCGNGRLALALASLGYRVVGLDISPQYIQDANRRAGMLGLLDRARFIAGDARILPRYFPPRYFDTVIMYWTTVLGYYDRDTDRRIMAGIREVTRDGGYLMILNTFNYELAVVRNMIWGFPPIFSEIDGETYLVESPKLDPVKGILHNKWVFYRKRNNDLEYLGSIEFSLKAYTLYELVELARETGWEYVTSYSSLRRLEEGFKPGISGFNVVFRAV